jgi:hypothetical protein
VCTRTSSDIESKVTETGKHRLRDIACKTLVLDWYDEAPRVPGYMCFVIMTKSVLVLE